MLPPLITFQQQKKKGKEGGAFLQRIASPGERNGVLRDSSPPEFLPENCRDDFWQARVTSPGLVFVWADVLLHSPCFPGLSSVPISAFNL